MPLFALLSLPQARIEQLRKGDLSLDLRYNDGSHVPAAAVQGLSVTLKKHDFPFGVAYRWVLPAPGMNSGTE